MKAHTASLINAITLMVCGVWAYLSIEMISFTPLIPAAFGIALVACNKGVKREDKIISHIAVVLTLVILIALYMPLSSALSSGEPLAILRSVLMVVTSVVAMVYFIKSFRDARRAREAS